MRYLLAGAILLLAVQPGAATDKILIVCGDSQGYSYNAQDGLAPSGWQKDSIAGQLSVILRDNGQYDLLAAGGPGGFNNFFYSNDGCQITKLQTFRSNQLTLLAQCRRYAETFLFTWNSDGSGSLLNVGAGSMAVLSGTRANAFQSSCQLKN